MHAKRGKVRQMSKPVTKYIAFLLFVILMTNIGVWGFSGARLAHELEHDGMEQAASHEHAHVHHVHHVHHGDEAGDDDDAPGVSEHQVLHAVDHLQFFPDTALSGAFVPTMASGVSLHFTEQHLPPPTFAPPFRPPRSGAFTA